MKRYIPPRRRRTSAPQSPSSGSRRFAVCVILCALTLACKFYYPQGVSALQDLILGPEGSRLQGAVQAMSEALNEGQGLPDAAEAFWEGMQGNAPS